MCEDWRSWARKDASTALRRSLCPWFATALSTLPRVRPLYVVLAVQVALGLAFVLLVATGNIPFTSGEPGRRPAARTDRFSSRAAYGLLRAQVEMGPRPAGSRASRELGDRLRRLLPQGRFATAPGGLRNVIGEVPGRD